ncbi:MAG: HAD family phosphatase, partial [Erysipelotrichaceae bacterium]|nr:HAD family phosphatase [Erysipelotrichaceae bacterium]
MIRWIISDLDGTLYRPDKTIDAMDAEAVRRWIASGRHFALASGRPIDSAREIQKEYGIVTEAMLSDSGATLHIHDQLAYESILPKSSIQKIYDIVEPYGKDINIISRETEKDGRSTVLMYYDGLFTTGFHHNWPTGTYLFKDWLAGPSGDLKKLFLITKTHELQTEVIEKLKEQCGEELDIATSDVCYAEICAKGTNKGAMLL